MLIFRQYSINKNNILCAFILSLFISCKTTESSNFELKDESFSPETNQLYSKRLDKRIPIRRQMTVKDFGALGDGRTDDTEAVKKAINFAIQNEKKKVIFDFTDFGYVITEEIVLEDLNGLTIEGRSPGGFNNKGILSRTFIWKGPPNKSVFKIGKTSSNITFSNLGFALGQGDSKALAAVFVDNTKNIVVRNLLIENCDINGGRFGVFLSGALGGNGDVAPVSIKNCLFRKQADNAIQSNNRNNQCYIYECHFLDIGNFPIKDKYNRSGKGASIFSAGALSIQNCSFVNLNAKPSSQEIRSVSGLVDIRNVWAESHGKLIKATGPIQLLNLSNIRHFRHTMSDKNTPVSVLLDAMNITVENCEFFGDIVFNGGQSGKLTVNNVKFYESKDRPILGRGRIRGKHIENKAIGVYNNVFSKTNGVGNIVIGGGPRFKDAPETLSGFAKQKKAQKGSAIVTSNVSTIAEFLSGDMKGSGCSFYMDQNNGDFYITANGYYEDGIGWKAYKAGEVTQLCIGSNEIIVLKGFSEESNKLVNLIEKSNL